MLFEKSTKIFDNLIAKKESKFKAPLLKVQEKAQKFRCTYGSCFYGLYACFCSGSIPRWENILSKTDFIKSEIEIWLGHGSAIVQQLKTKEVLFVNCQKVLTSECGDLYCCFL